MEQLAKIWTFLQIKIWEKTLRAGTHIAFADFKFDAVGGISTTKNPVRKSMKVPLPYFADWKKGKVLFSKLSGKIQIVPMIVNPQPRGMTL